MNRSHLQARLDAAILANRIDPSPENQARVMDLMRQKNEAFHHEQAEEFIRRTR